MSERGGGRKRKRDRWRGAKEREGGRVGGSVVGHILEITFLLP